ncbi:MAG: hypothetical protein HYX48_04550 [Chlamydiales bacterium]|nr:hypothetical protein [Chlamydiales bacterium]
MSTLSITARNLDTSRQNLNPPLQAVEPNLYITGDGTLYRPTGLVDRFIQWILDSLFDYKIAKICTVFQTLIIEYAAEQTRDTTPEYSLDQKNALLAAQRLRINFVVDYLIGGNRANFDRYAANSPLLSLAVTNYERHERNPATGIDRIEALERTVEGLQTALRESNIALKDFKTLYNITDAPGAGRDERKAAPKLPAPQPAERKRQ